MKRILYILPLLLASLTACHKEEATDIPVAAEQLLLTVADGGYASTDGTQSRATDNDLQTVFEAGDQVGFFSVGKNNALEVNNLCMTAKTIDGKLVWEASAGTTLLTANRYFIYYPYQPTLPGEVDATKTTATEFFAGVVGAWTPAADQSTQALYTASDLMVGRGVAGEIGSDGKRLVSVTLNHAMGLVFISLPSLTYAFTNDSPIDIPDYTLPVSDAKFIDFKPLAMGDDKYRYLIKPGIDNTLQGTFTRNSESKKYSITANVAGGAFKACFVDGGGGTITHTLAIGDFYMKDGTLISRDATLTAEQKANCLGIVLKVGKDPAGWRFQDVADYTLKNGTTSAAIHAYVLALHGGNRNQSLSWGSNGTGVGTGQSRDDVEEGADAIDPIGFHGYIYTQMIKAKAPSLGQAFQTAFPAAYYASDGYEKEHASPANSSGWFLPSVGQCKYWLENKDNLFESLLKAGGTDWRDNYLGKAHWSSSEVLNQESGYVYYVILSDHSLIDSYTKDPNIGNHSFFYVRSVLAF